MNFIKHIIKQTYSGIEVSLVESEKYIEVYFDICKIYE